MEQLSRLQARIATLGELKNLIRAMRALAASHIQEAHDALGAIRRYVGVIEDAIIQGAALAGDGSDEATLPSDPGMLIVMCSEHGFVGSMNERLIDAAAARRLPGQALVVAGRKGAMLAADRDLDLQRRVSMPTDSGGVLGCAREVSAFVSAFSAVDVIYARYRRGGGFETEHKRVLPLEPRLLQASRERMPPIHHLAPDTLLERLANEYLLAEITRMVTESVASENGARLQLMDAADHNIRDKLEGLYRRHRTLRQAEITAELLDLVIGSEAMMTEPS